MNPDPGIHPFAALTLNEVQHPTHRASGHVVRLKPLLWPLNWKELSGRFRRKIATCKTHGIGKYYVAIGGEIARCRHHCDVGIHAGVFQAFPVRRQDIRLANLRAIIWRSTVRGGREAMTIEVRFHNASGCPVSDNCSAAL